MADSKNVEYNPPSDFPPEMREFMKEYVDLCIKHGIHLCVDGYYDDVHLAVARMYDHDYTYPEWDGVRLLKTAT